MKGRLPRVACWRINTAAFVLLCLFFGLFGALVSSPVKSQELQNAPEAVRFSENFDSVISPQLPSGWTTSQTGSGTLFLTTVTTPDTAPNAAFTQSPATAGLADITSPAIQLGSLPTRLSFRHLYRTEPDAGFDGGVLEVSVAGGPFQDILIAGGQFFAGGYTTTILNSATGNPLIGRQAWSGVASAYGPVILDLPATMLNQSIRLRWRYGTDQEYGGQGWWIDGVQISEERPTTGIVTTISNTAPISIPNQGVGTPYPSVINVTNITSVISKVTVKLHNVSHTFPSDIDILLVGPAGHNALIMSDVGGASDINGITLTLDDSSPTPMSNAQLVTATYQPTNLEAGDVFPAPAPPPIGNSPLSIFNGSNPNGTWRLFVFDDVGGDVGSISGGWTLTITNAISGENPNAISIPASGIASPYPSEIPITNHNNPIAKVEVNLLNFSHSSPDDVDLLLVSPSGRKVVLMSDVGGNNPVSNLNLSFDDNAAAAMPDSAMLTSGSFKPTDFEAGDNFPAPAPVGAPTGSLLSSLNGSVANGAWKLFLVDDNGNNAGSISGGWNILVQSSTTDVINIPLSGVAAPYPAEVTVTGQPGSIINTTVRLINFSHTSPDDVDILLVSPSGRKTVLMSDVGGGTEVGGLNITFNDAAPTGLPDDTPLTSGSYRPTNFEAGDTFPAPAPTSGNTGTTLGTFYGSAPNGIWKLFVVDDSGSNLGSIAGYWSLTLQTSTSACSFSLSPTVQAFPVQGGTGNFGINMPNGCSWFVSRADSFISITTPSSGDGSGSVGFSIAPNTGPPRSGLIEISNGVAVRTVQIQQAAGCPFSASETSVVIGASGGPGNVSITASSGCTWQPTTNVSWIQITSGQQTGNGTIAFNVSPNTGAGQRNATITAGSVTINVNQRAVAGTKFDFGGDGKADISVFRPATGTWWIQNSAQAGNYTGTAFGISTDKTTPADFDGDRKTDIAVFRDGVWYLLESQTGAFRIIYWGTAGDVAVPSDYDGDGKADAAVYRGSAGRWYVLRSSDGTFYQATLGLATDKPVPADYDGDGRTDIAIYRNGTNPGDLSFWTIAHSANGTTVNRQFGVNGDLPVPADFNGDGREDIAVFRPSNGTWYRSTGPNPGNYASQPWGTSSDIPSPADFDGDGTADFAVFRQGNWYILNSVGGTVRFEPWGTNGDIPVPAAFILP